MLTVADLPPLPDASCVGQHALFDPVLGNGHRYREGTGTPDEAPTVCAACPSDAVHHGGGGRAAKFYACAPLDPARLARRRVGCGQRRAG
jgi:hypothetical protein